MSDMLQVGVITSTHGLKGEVKVFPTTDDVNRYKKLKEVILLIGKDEINLKIESVKFFKNQVIVKFVGINDIDDVIRYKGESVYVSRENAVKCEKDEYFIADLIGVEVYENGDALGRITDVIQTGANDVYVVEMVDKKELLIPAIKDCILEVSIKNNRMNVKLLEGLLD